MSGVVATGEKGAPYFVSAETVRSLVTVEDAIGAMRAAYTQPDDAGANPDRIVAREGGAWMRVLTAIPAGSRFFGAKLMAMARGAARPGVDYVIVLFDRERSRLAGLVDGNIVTGYRTAATSAAALDRLAPPGPARLAVLGSGFEASMHLRAFAAVRELEEVVVYSPTPRRRQAFARTASEELDIPCSVADSAEAAVKTIHGGPGVVLAAARSRGEKPILFGEWLRPETTVVSIGSTVPEQREIDVSVVARCGLIVCDSLPEVLESTGDMIEAARVGTPLRDKCCSLSALLRGELDERRRGSDVSMFKSVGMGLQDVALAGLALERALDAGVATRLPIELVTKF